MLVAIWHGGRTLSGEGSSYSRILIGRWRDMVPCVLRPDIGVLGEESRITSKLWNTEMRPQRSRTFLEPKGGLDALISWTDDVHFGIMLRAEVKSCAAVLLCQSGSLDDIDHLFHPTSHTSFLISCPPSLPPSLTTVLKEMISRSSTTKSSAPSQRNPVPPVSPLLFQ
jgi:hypothetical protein